MARRTAGRVIDMTLPAHFWSKVDKTFDCWNWTGSLQSSGYGCWTFNGKRVLAHRVAYERLVGPIPAGLQIDHLCRNKVCVNPDHLEPVTAAVNMSRTPQALATHCHKGHPLSGSNLGRTGKGSRRCMQCNRDTAAAHRERRRLEKLARAS